LRSAHFASLRTPAFFVHGARDGFGSPEEMDAALRLIPVPTKLTLIAGAGHELMTNRNREVLIAQIVPAFLSFAN
jgi:predicted alpha/beta-hydrolase family hydrolase